MLIIAQPTYILVSLLAQQRNTSQILVVGHNGPQLYAFLYIEDLTRVLILIEFELGKIDKMQGLSSLIEDLI